MHVYTKIYVVEVTCTKCRREKPQDAFVFKKKRKRYEAVCKQCWNSAKEQKRKTQRELIAASKRRPCATCGVVMTDQIAVFVDPKTKERVKLYTYIQASLSPKTTIEKLANLTCVCLNCFGLGRLG